MRALKWLLCFGFIITSSLAAWASEHEHQYGIELRGGFSRYLNMKDPNDFVKNFPWSQGYAGSKIDKSLGSIGGGFSLLYKSKPSFAWHVGLNVLGTDSASATAISGNQSQQTRVITRAVELFFTANYYWNLTPRLNLEFGAGPSFYLASMDREKPTQYDDQYTSFYGAHGRAFGFVGTIGGELFLGRGVSLKVGGGFRMAHVARFKYIEETSGAQAIQIGKIAYWDVGGFNTFEADYTGPFAEAGLRVYFEPKGEWGHGKLRGE